MKLQSHRDSTVSLMTMSSEASTDRSTDDISSMNSSSKFFIKIFFLNKKKHFNLFSSGFFDNTIDRSDRKISAHATLETPPTRTPFPGDHHPIPKTIPEHEELDNRPRPPSPVITSKGTKKSRKNLIFGFKFNSSRVNFLIQLET
jgi:hypothetical protein